MSKPQKRIDSRQLSIFDYDEKIEEYISIKEEILNTPVKNEKEAHSWEEDCIEIVSSIKKAIKMSGVSRKAIPDLVNKYYGWPSIEEFKKISLAKRKGLKHLSLEMLNHYLSKPTEYPIYAFYIYAIQRVTNSLEPCRSFAEAEDAQVISGDEVRHMRIGKLDDALSEIQKLKRELKVKR